MTPLQQIIHDEIALHGPMTVERFMALALQHDVYGYYRKDDPLGKDGDFITAPEISQMFGEMIGLWLVEMWRALKCPPKVALLELGAGRGTLMHDALRATQHVSGFHDALTLYLFEANETLRGKQQERLSAYHPRFIDSLLDLPDCPLLIIANEFFDAMPVRQFVECDDKGDFFRAERKITTCDDRLVFVNDPEISASLLPLSTLYEVCPDGLAIMGDLAHRIAHQRGAFLIIDYGYALPINASTLQAVSGHTSVDFLDRVGDVDLTAHVDFMALAKMAVKSGAKSFGVTGQGAFLKALGIDIRASLLQQKATPAQAQDIAAAHRRLVDAAEMGTLFKVMSVVSSDIDNDIGFA